MISAIDNVDQDESIEQLMAEYGKKDSDDDMQSEKDIDTHNDDNQEEERKGRRIDPTAKKRVVINPIPKLNTERLKGPKGIHTIENYFKGFKYYGKNHEKHDLDRLMKRLEHWAYRLFPKLTFDDFIAKTEKLGAKKDLQTFVKKYRLGMLTADFDLLVEDNNELEEAKDVAPLDAFDFILSEQIDKTIQSFSPEPHKERSIYHNTTSLGDISSQGVLQGLVKEQSNIDIDKTSSVLTDEVKDRIERNRQLAIQRRLNRLKASREGETSITECIPVENDVGTL